MTELLCTVNTHLRWAKSAMCIDLKQRLIFFYNNFGRQQHIFGTPQGMHPYIFAFILHHAFFYSLVTTDPPSKQNFKPSKQNYVQCSQPQKKRKNSLPPLACTQQAYGEKEYFAWTGNFLKMPHTSKKSYFIQ